MAWNVTKRCRSQEKKTGLSLKRVGGLSQDLKEVRKTELDRT